MSTHGRRGRIARRSASTLPGEVKKLQPRDDAEAVGASGIGEHAARVVGAYRVNGGNSELHERAADLADHDVRAEKSLERRVEDFLLYGESPVDLSMNRTFVGSRL